MIENCILDHKGLRHIFKLEYLISGHAGWILYTDWSRYYNWLRYYFLLVWFYSLKSVYGQSLQTYDNPLLEFEFQYPSEWKRVMTEGLTGVGFSLYKLNNTEPNVYDTFGFMTIDIPETKTLKQYLRDLNLILKINSSTLKLVESKLSGFSAMNATWIERNNKVEMIYTILDKTVYILQFLTVESSNRITFFVDTSAIEFH